MPILTLELPISARSLPISAKSALKTAICCRFCILGTLELPKVMPIMLICIYTMCQNNSSEPASVQTLIFTHRYGVKNFSSMFQYYCPFRYCRCSTSALAVCTPSFTYVCIDSCVVKYFVNTGNYSGKHLLMYVQTYV